MKLDRNYALADFLQCKLALDVAEKERNEAVAEQTRRGTSFFGSCVRIPRLPRSATKPGLRSAATEAWKRLLGDEAAGSRRGRETA